jgi:cytochrome c oxidase cbb3-type subunit 4
MLSGIVTLLLIALFLGAWAWAWQPERKPEFEAAARLPLEDLAHADDTHAPATNKEILK